MFLKKTNEKGPIYYWGSSPVHTNYSCCIYFSILCKLIDCVHPHELKILPIMRYLIGISKTIIKQLDLQVLKI